ncbi:hypothetical protein HW555_004367 [Spodoptera exigua]|uniref:Cytochrome p450 n=1 Tax=Spodoptera exigua TaxID=7107 RepID=A0A835GMA0_SPOEX|nr:hypothetical protein HW555_004367 [Spodoptera exigua]
MLRQQLGQKVKQQAVALHKDDTITTMQYAVSSLQAKAMWPIIALSVLYLFFVLNSKFGRPRLYPPGPTPLPICGNLLSVALKLRSNIPHHVLWRSWAHIYGNILGLKLGFINVVIVSGKELIKEVSTREVFDGRPDGFFFLMRSFGKKLGIVFNDGPSWSKTRRVVLKYLKSFGYNSKFMESYIAEECRALVKLRTGDAGQPILVNSMFNISIVNILWRLVAGKRYDLEDRKLKTLCDLIMRLFRAVDMSGGILNFMPFVRHILPGLSGYTELTSIHKALHDFLRETIQEHQQNIDVNNPRDVIDAFLIEKIECKDQFYEELQVVCLDLLEAGMETVSNTAVFMLLHIVCNYDVQRKLHHEIDDIIGPLRPPALSDRTSMVYTEAVLLESLRISSVAAMGIPHMALDDARLGDYIIPKGTFILLAMFDLHNSPHWTDPDVFRRRRCIGEGLARSELFMFLTHILQKFYLKIPDGETVPSLEPNDGLSLSAKPFKIVFESRNNL